jgi:hypothetical protein
MVNCGRDERRKRGRGTDNPGWQISLGEDFMFKLTGVEKVEVVANCDHLKKLKFSPVLPFVFTEHGAIMAANVLNSKTAVQASVQVVRAFIRLRRMLTSNAELSGKLNELENKYDARRISLSVDS